MSDSQGITVDLEEAPPERRHVLELTVGADTVIDLADRLRDFAELIEIEPERFDRENNGAALGPRSKLEFTVRLNPEMTGPRYRAALAAWTERQRQSEHLADSELTGVIVR